MKTPHYRVYRDRKSTLYGIEVKYPGAEDMFPIREKPLFFWKDKAEQDIERRRTNYERAMQQY